MRRFPPPWTIDEANDACFIVRDNNRQALGYFYVEEEPGRRSAAKLRTRDEARRLAVNFAKLLRVGPAQIATGCCLVAAIITANTINRGGDFRANRIQAAASVTRLSVSWPGHPPSPPKPAGEPWSRASAGLCVCESPPRPPHSSCTPYFKSTVTEVTGSLIKSGQDRNRDGSVKAAGSSQVLRVFLLRIGDRIFEPSANGERLSSSRLDVDQMAAGGNRHF